MTTALYWFTVTEEGRSDVLSVHWVKNTIEKDVN